MKSGEIVREYEGDGKFENLKNFSIMMKNNKGVETEKLSTVFKLPLNAKVHDVKSSQSNESETMSQSESMESLVHSVENQTIESSNDEEFLALKALDDILTRNATNMTESSSSESAQAINIGDLMNMYHDNKSSGDKSKESSENANDEGSDEYDEAEDSEEKGDEMNRMENDGSSDESSPQSLE
jgi:hypothetical protein